MWYEIAANLTALAHLAFLAFVVFGAFLGRRRRVWKYLHFGAMAYGLAIETFYWVCPLTYLEQYLRRRAGRGIYEEPFIAHYVNRLIYVDLPQWSLIVAAVLVLAINVILYTRWSASHPPAEPKGAAGA